jgi:hypothetical protein
MLYHLKPSKLIVLAAFALISLSSAAMAQNVAGVIGNVQTQTSLMPRFIVGILYIMGVFFMVRGSYGFYEFAKDAKSKWTNAVGTMGLGAFLIALPATYNWSRDTLLGGASGTAPAMKAIDSADLSIFKP